MLMVIPPRLINLITGGTLVSYIVMCVNYLFFYRALKAQGYSRDALPYRGYFQPWGTWVALIWLIGIEVFYGYEVFLHGQWDVGTFFTHYTMIFLAICIFFVWKIGKRTRFMRPEEADLVWARPAVDAHEATMDEEDCAGLHRQVMQMFWIRGAKDRLSGRSRV